MSTTAVVLAIVIAVSSGLLTFGLLCVAKAMEHAEKSREDHKEAMEQHQRALVRSGRLRPEVVDVGKRTTGAHV
jgi:hypothetical protein